MKQATDLVRLFERYAPGGAVRRAGNDFVCLCPFHSERSPSMTIYPDDGRYHCFGCGAHGDAITLVCEREHVQFQEAVERLAKDAQITLEDQARASANGPREDFTELFRAMEIATAFYEAQLVAPGGAHARAYLDGRKFARDVLGRHRVGWAPGGRALLDHARSQGVPEGAMEAAGLAKKREGRLVDRFYRRITVPILDQRGRPIAFTARALDEDLLLAGQQGRKVGKWINTAETPIYSKGSVVYNLGRAASAARAWSQREGRRRLLIVEGALDVIALDQAGHAEACAPCGTAITPAQAAAIAKAAAGRVEIFLVLDGDAAGRNRSPDAARELLATGATIRVAMMPKDADPAELLVEDPSDEHAQAWQDVLSTAQPAMPWLIDQLLPPAERIDEARRLHTFDDIAEILDRIPDQDLRDLYVDSCAKQLGVPRKSAKRRLEARRATVSAPGTSVPGSPGTPSQGARGNGSTIELRYALNELGNAQRFADRCGLDCRYCHTWGVWLVWQGTHWEIDRTHEVDRRMTAAIQATVNDEIEALSKRLAETIVPVMQERIQEAIETLTKWEVKNGNDRAVMNSLSRASTLAALGIIADQLDIDPWAFTVKNGTLDLRTGVMREHSRDDWITRFCDVPYNPQAWDDRWHQFLADFTGEDELLGAYVQRAVGYAMTGVTKEDAVWMWAGPGGNGKGTLAGAVQRMLGSYARPLPFEIFLVSNSDKRKWSLAEASQCRLILCEESEEGKRFNAALVKQVSGGTWIEAERKHGQPFTYLPRFKVWFITNTTPGVSDQDQGFWRRLHLVKCEFKPPKADTDLRDYFQQNASARAAILAWAVDGARQYAAQGLDAPASVREAGREYRDEQNPLRDFLFENCIIEPDRAEQSQIIGTEFMSRYRAYCEELKIRHPLSAKAIANRLNELGCETGEGVWIYQRGPDGTKGKSRRGYAGIRWRNPGEEPRAPGEPAPRIAGTDDDRSGALTDQTAAIDFSAPSNVLATPPLSATDTPGAPDSASDRNPIRSAPNSSADSHLPASAPDTTDRASRTRVRKDFSSTHFSGEERNPDLSEAPGALTPEPPPSRRESPHTGDGRIHRLLRPLSDDEDLFSNPTPPDHPFAADEPADGITDDPQE